MSFGEMVKFSLSKLTLEFFGTMILTMLFITNQEGILLLGLWILTIFCWKISSAMLNPAVTLAFMLRKDAKKIHVSMGVLLIAT